MADRILKPHFQSTVARLASLPIVLAVQDTTSIDFTGRSSIEGLGPLREEYLRGLLVHSTLCVSPDGTPLGLVGQEVWARDPEEQGKAKKRRQRSTAEKESQRWLDALSASDKLVPAGVRVVTVADREADFFGFLAHPRREGSEVLIRVTQDRRVEGEERYLKASIQNTAPRGVSASRSSVGMSVQREPPRGGSASRSKARIVAAVDDITRGIT